ncbi:MAG TPA: FAD-dependent oxidoreductase [Candidatus Jorgensenbacteria bacterium]|uniref:FAD dependent oxidoreductase domain-containing protein n=1 Tax=marine sediment metagenome TaxID=412755 RepID=A0A0F9HVJ0_9ZZZZ|nr:FAD-dependent oxidoreductase [Candidatus Jorgensenbacteria bacterium]
MNFKKPRILLIGVGKFGNKHLKVLLNLEQKRLIKLAGVVVKTKRSQQKFKRKYAFPVYNEISNTLLDDVDAVDIVTPPETHFELVLKCLPRTHILVEKPLAVTVKEASLIKRHAKASPHILMVGHIFRFHPVTIQLKKIIKATKELPHSIESTFINPIVTDNGRDVELEMLHPFDIIDYLFGKALIKKHVEDKGRLKVVSLVYRRGIHAVVRLGWSGKEKKRTLSLLFRRNQIVCNFEENTITVYENGLIKKHINCNNTVELLETELRAFVRAIHTPNSEYPDAEVGHRIVKIATTKQADRVPVSAKKKVAIIGAGIFGTNCAIELAPFCNVTLFEKNKSILSEASYINQYRHHWGYHYPRSQETVNDIASSIADFENRYKEAIITEFPTYYSVAKEGSKVTPKRYLEFCKRNNLPFTIECPGERFINKEKIALCIKTYEPIYNYAKLKSITEQLLKKHRVKLRLGREVVGASILQDGRKALRVKKDGVVHEEYFDYVINVTYARYNDFCAWLNFPRKPVRIDLVETLWVKLNIPRISLAVMDGPFTNIVPTHKENVFTLVHIKESILRRFVPKNGLVPKDIFLSSRNSRVQKIISYSAKWFPIVKEAKVLKVHYVLRSVNAYHEYDDARISNTTEHGFGCFSILGGKIVNAVSSAKNIVRLIID